MVYKLSDQMDKVGDPNLPFDTYQSYIDENKHLFPKSALSLMSLDNWYSGGSRSKSPYWSDLKQVDVDLRNKQLKVVLVKNDYVENPFSIILKYIGVVKFDIPEFLLPGDECVKWCYEEILHFQFSKKKDTPLFCHNIEWSNGDVWSICAENIEAEWD